MLLAAYNGCSVLLRIDNTTAISYINRMGGIQYPKLSNLTRKIWQWCEQRNLYIFASYIKSSDNKIADQESRTLKPETEWELNSKIFTKIVTKFGELHIDLFATHCNKKCDRYVSWVQDPGSLGTDAFTFSWTKEFFYAFPPFSLILRVLQKIQSEKATGILVVPHWPTQPWFPIFKKLLIEKPLYIYPHLIISFSRDIHPLHSALTLVAGKLSGRHLL